MLGTVSKHLSVCRTSEAHPLHGSATRAEDPMRLDRKDLRVLS
jgi:hypothetical protein